eukprot:SAG31_NODE_2623_length_5361_cov_97.321361_2_plen_127_part_00
MTIGVADVENIVKVAHWTDVLSYHTSVPLSQPEPPIPRATHLGSAPNGHPSELEWGQMGQPSGFRVTRSGRDADGRTDGIARIGTDQIAADTAAALRMPLINSQSGCVHRSENLPCCSIALYFRCS